MPVNMAIACPYNDYRVPMRVTPGVTIACPNHACGRGGAGSDDVGRATDHAAAGPRGRAAQTAPAKPRSHAVSTPFYACITRVSVARRVRWWWLAGSLRCCVVTGGYTDTSASVRDLRVAWRRHSPLTPNTKSYRTVPRIPSGGGRVWGTGAAFPHFPCVSCTAHLDPPPPRGTNEGGGERTSSSLPVETGIAIDTVRTRTILRLNAPRGAGSVAR